MPYPQVSAPYGLKPVNLIGGQVFSGSTRSLPIQYGYGTNIFYGDFVVLSRGFITRAAVSTGTAVNQVRQPDARRYTRKASQKKVSSTTLQALSGRG